MALFTGLCMGVTQAQTFSPPWDDPITGYLIVYDVKGGSVAWDGGVEGTDITGPYALPLQRAITSDTLTFDFLPETNKYWNGGSGGASYWQNGSGDGGKYLDNLTFWNRAVTGAETNASLDFTINSNTLLTNRYEFTAFIKIVDVGTGGALAIVETNIADQVGSFSLELPLGGSFVGAPLQAGFRMSGTNANPDNVAAYGGVNLTVSNVGSGLSDPEPPSPDPLTWEVAPYTISDDKIGMTVTTATDISLPVVYEFYAYKGASIPGDGFAGASGDVTDPHYVFEGLLPNQQYTFRARARDSFDTPNIGGFTPNASATTVATDTTAPSPDPAEIASNVASPISLWMTATPATDASAIEYNFVPANTNNNAYESGWQDSNEFFATGLVPDTEYSYTVQVRDLSAATNTTAVSAASVNTTLSAPATASFTNSLKGFTPGSSTSGAVLTELAQAGFEVASTSPEKAITAGPNGLTFGTDGSETFNDRNIVRTIASDYGDGDFTVEVSFIYSNQIEQVCFAGVGHGLQGEFNVPDFYLEGVSGVLTETSNAREKIFAWFEGVLQDVVETNGIVTLENRVRLTYTADPEPQATYEIDYDNDGVGGFVADFTLGPVSLTNVWQTGAPQRVYISGGAGTTLFDLAVTFEGVTSVPVGDLTIVSVVGGTATLQWTGLSGQTYNVQYKTDLSAATWTADPANQGITGAGVLTPTSTIAGDEVFYQVETE
jgi:hypothetical protein